MESIDDTSPKIIFKAGIEPVTYLLVLKLGSFRLVKFQRRKKYNSLNLVQGAHPTHHVGHTTCVRFNVLLILNIY